ncbi:MAG TPA: radical SAM protein [Methanosarcinaceae archaeon]|nr:radical SAM protein [Methanosarcinaceae archaeon]
MLKKQRIIYGPVPSRRLGRSLGIDIIGPEKTCNFDCVYCQLGHTDKKVSGPQDVCGVSTEEVLVELKNHLKKVKHLDYITFSGTGEPTLNLALGDMIRNVKKITNVPVCVITNSSLIDRMDVRDNLAQADLVVATLEAGDEKTFMAINRPASGIRLDDIIKGLKALGVMGPRLEIEILFVDSKMDNPTNASEQAVNELIGAVKIIDPDMVEVFTVSRPPAENFIIPVSRQRLIQIAQKFDEALGRENVRLVFKGLRRKNAGIKHGNKRNEVYDLLVRRPCTADQISFTLEIENKDLVDIIDDLLGKKEIVEITAEDGKYYRAV